MIQKSTFDFLKALRKNNNRDWFEKNKEKYIAAKENVESLMDDILKSFAVLDKKFGSMRGKECTFRIYRDVRFSKDKSPYKTNMGAWMNPNGKKSMTAGYYLHIEPGNCFFAGGVWMPPSDELKKIRQEIDYNAKSFHKVIDEKAFKKYFGSLNDESKLSRPPKGYDASHPEVEFLKLNSFTVWHRLKDEEILSKKFVAEITKGAKLMKPFIQFLNTALD